MKAIQCIIFLLLSCGSLCATASVLAVAAPAAMPPFILEQKVAVARAVSDSMVACAMDAIVCPDGSSVGRSGPRCEFKCPGKDAPKGHEKR